MTDNQLTLISQRTISVRLTVPLYQFHIHSGEPNDRERLSNNVWLGRLDPKEIERIWRAHGKRDHLEWRLEVHSIPYEIMLYEDDEGLPYEEFNGIDPDRYIRRILSLLACSFRRVPRWESIALDEYNGEEWQRISIHFSPGGPAPDPPFGYSRYGWCGVPHPRIRTWARLISNFPPFEAHPKIETALDHYLDSVVDIGFGRFDKALTAAAISLEVLLGSEHSEIRSRLAQRGALLTSEGSDSIEVSRFLKKWYDMRSKYIHAGVSPDPDDVIRIHQFLMRAIPSMARLCENGEFAESIRLLDEAPFVRSERLESLFETDDAWWGQIPLAETLRREDPEVSES